jgi:hypothetical protein
MGWGGKSEDDEKDGERVCAGADECFCVMWFEVVGYQGEEGGKCCA